jgi:hypothetical protein
MEEAIIVHDLYLADDPFGRPFNATLMKGKTVISKFPGIEITIQEAK